MRSELELLRILREYLTEESIREANGLCILTLHIQHTSIISPFESRLLREIINSNVYTYKGNVAINYKTGYYWQPQALEPRIMYVDWLIEQRSDKESMKSTIWKIVLTHVKRILGR